MVCIGLQKKNRLLKIHISESKQRRSLYSPQCSDLHACIMQSFPPSSLRDSWNGGWTRAAVRDRNHRITNSHVSISTSVHRTVTFYTAPHAFLSGQRDELPFTFKRNISSREKRGNGKFFELAGPPRIDVRCYTSQLSFLILRMCPPLLPSGGGSSNYTVHELPRIFKRLNEIWLSSNPILCTCKHKCTSNIKAITMQNNV